MKIFRNNRAEKLQAEVMRLREKLSRGDNAADKG